MTYSIIVKRELGGDGGGIDIASATVFGRSTLDVGVPAAAIVVKSGVT